MISALILGGYQIFTNHKNLGMQIKHSKKPEKMYWTQIIYLPINALKCYPKYFLHYDLRPTETNQLDIGWFLYRYVPWPKIISKILSHQDNRLITSNYGQSCVTSLKANHLTSLEFQFVRRPRLTLCLNLTFFNCLRKMWEIKWRPKRTQSHSQDTRGSHKSASPSIH